MLADTVNRQVNVQLFDDFLKFDAGFWADTNSGSSPPPISVANASGGWLQCATHATLNDYRSVSTPAVWEILPDKPVLIEARIKIAEAAPNSSGWYFGLTDTLTAGFLSASGQPPSSYRGAVVWKAPGSNVIAFQTSNGTNQRTIAKLGTFESGSPLLLSIAFDPGGSSPSIAPGSMFLASPLIGTPAGLQFDQQAGARRALPIPVAGLVPMCLSVGVLAGTAAAETLQVDYAGVDSYRS